MCLIRPFQRLKNDQFCPVSLRYTMLRIFEYTIAPSEEGCSIQEYLRGKGYSHHVLTRLKRIKQGITVDGVFMHVTEPLKSGQILIIRLEEQESSERIIPVKMPLDIVYEDQDIMVVNKPADTPIHPSQNNYENTLANGIAYHFFQKNEAFVFRCINRIDRDTTGLTILAKNMVSGCILSRQMLERKIHREYLAVVSGNPPLEGTINAPIGRLEGSTIERTIDWEHGENAITHFKKEKQKDGLALVRLWLDTGRTHQIRVHMKSIGFPIIGDFLYNPDYSKISRQALHSCRLEFDHPVTGEKLCFDVPAPSDFPIR